jgi:hypothetical protein
MGDRCKRMTQVQDKPTAKFMKSKKTMLENLMSKLWGSDGARPVQKNLQKQEGWQQDRFFKKGKSWMLEDLKRSLGKWMKSLNIKQALNEGTVSKMWGTWYASILICWYLKKSNNMSAGHQWLTSAILATWEAEIRRIVVRGQPRQMVPKTLTWKYSM